MKLVLLVECPRKHTCCSRIDTKRNAIRLRRAIVVRNVVAHVWKLVDWPEHHLITPVLSHLLG